MARRLVEAGVSVVTLKVGDWDTHEKNFSDMREQLPQLDQGFHALVTDLYERGLDKDVAVVLWGEFGRAPRISRGDGRDHWPEAGAAVLAGGGFKVGQVIGETDAHGGRSKGNPYTPGNVLANLYRHLGIDPATTIPDHEAADARARRPRAGAGAGVEDSPVSHFPSRTTAGLLNGSASGGALSVFKNATSADWSSRPSSWYFAVTSFASPRWRRMADSSVVTAPSWKYGAESATPHSGGVFHSSGCGRWSGRSRSFSSRGGFGAVARIAAARRIRIVERVEQKVAVDAFHAAHVRHVAKGAPDRSE